MAGKLVEDVKFLHGGIAVHHLRTFGEIFERELKLPGQVDYGRKCGQGIATFYRELQSVKARQHTTQDTGLMRAVLIYSKEFFQMFSSSNQGDAKSVAELLVECLDNGFMAELLIDSSFRQAVDEFYTRCGVLRQAKPIDSSNYIPNMDHGALTEAIYKQWFGGNAKLSDVFGGAEAMDVDDDAYKPDEVRIIHYGLNREDTLRPLGRAFEDDVGISGQATYETYKKRNKHPSDVIIKDMKKVQSDIEEQTHGVLMWNLEFIRILQERPETIKTIEDLLENDYIPAEGCCRQFANVLMTDIDLQQFQTFSPTLFRILAQPNRVVRLKNCLGKDHQSINFQDLSRAIYKVWIGAQSSLSDLTERHELEAEPSYDYKEPPISSDQFKVPPSISVSSREPVESEYHSSDFLSESSLELDLQVVSEASKTPPMHSMEMNGPASSRGRSSDGSCETNQPITAAAMQTGAADNAPANHIRSVHQQTQDGSNGSAKYIPSGTSCSYDRNIAHKALHTTNISIKDARLDSLEAKISEIGLQQQGAPREGPASLRGPSLEEGAKNPLKKEATPGKVNDVNKFASSKSQQSFAMDASNQVQADQPRDWSLCRTVDKEGLVKLGHESLGTEVAKSSTAGTQTVSGNDEGRQMSVTGWVPPPLGSHSGESLIHRSVSASTQTHPVSEDDGGHLSRQSWNAPKHLESGNLQGQSLPNQSVDKAPNEARSDLDQGYKMPSGNYQKGAELLKDSHAEMALASGNGGGFQRMDQMEIAGNGQSESDSTHRSSSENHMSTRPNQNGYAATEASSLRSQDHHSMAIGHEPCTHLGPDEMAMASGHHDIMDREDRQRQDNYEEPVSSMCANSRSMGSRGSGVGEDSPSESTQYRQQNLQNGHITNGHKDFGDLSTNGTRPLFQHIHNGSPHSMQFYYNPEPYLSSGTHMGRSVSVPSNFRLNADKEGLFMNNFRNNRNKKNIEPVASVTSSSNSSNYSSLQVEKTLLRNLNQDCIKKIKIRLDPLKSIIPDWRNIAGRFGVDSDTINYWKGTPEPGKGPTEHLLEFLRTENQDLSVDEFKEVLTHYKRYDVLDILKKQNL